MFNVQCGPMTNKEYQIFPAASAPEVDIEIHFLFNFKGNNRNSISLFFDKQGLHIFIMHFLHAFCPLLLTRSLQCCFLPS